MSNPNAAASADRQPAGPAPGADSDDDSSAPDSAARALFHLVRLFSRQPLPDLLAGRTGRAVELSRILVVQAIEAGPEEPAGEVTVGAVAERLGVDPSTASRLVAEVLRDGYLARAASPADGRRARLELTDAGRALAEDARRYQRAVFERATRDWTEPERRLFARLFVRFVDAIAEARAGTSADGG